MERIKPRVWKEVVDPKGGLPRFFLPYPRSVDRMRAAPFSLDLVILPHFSLLYVMRRPLDTDLTKK